MTEDEYNAIDAVRWSHLKHMDTSPLAYQHALIASYDSAAMQLGRLVHAMVLEPDRVAEGWVMFDGKVRRGKAHDECVAANPGKEIVTADAMERAHAIARSVRSHPLVAPMLSTGEPEQSIVWTDPGTGIRCKARIDWLSDSHRWDLKTTSDINPRRIGSTVARYMWHGQAAFHGMGLVDDLPTSLIFVQTEAPYDVLVMSVPDETMQAGRRLARRLLDRLAECLESDEWPGLTQDEPMPLYLPEWALEEAAGAGVLDLGDGVKLAV